MAAVLSFRVPNYGSTIVPLPSSLTLVKSIFHTSSLLEMMFLLRFIKGKEKELPRAKTTPIKRYAVNDSMGRALRINYLFHSYEWTYRAASLSQSKLGFLIEECLCRHDISSLDYLEKQNSS